MGEAPSGLLFPHPIEHGTGLRGFDRAQSQGVHADATPCQMRAQVAPELGHCGLGRGEGHLGGRGAHACEEGAGQHDRAARVHHRHPVSAAEHRRGENGLEDPLPDLVGRLQQAVVLAVHGAGVDVEHVDPAELRMDTLERQSCLSLDPQVCHDYRKEDVRRLPVDSDHLPTLGSEPCRDSAGDGSARAGDDADPPAQPSLVVAVPAHVRPSHRSRSMPPVPVPTVPACNGLGGSSRTAPHATCSPAVSLPRIVINKHSVTAERPTPPDYSESGISHTITPSGARSHRKSGGSDSHRRRGAQPPRKTQPGTR